LASAAARLCSSGRSRSAGRCRRRRGQHDAHETKDKPDARPDPNLAPALGPPLIVEYKPCGGIHIANRLLIDSPHDGHRLMFAANAVAASATLWQPLLNASNLRKKIQWQQPGRQA
jgi:hypothetical protein